MKILFIIFSLTLVFCVYAHASDIAFYVGNPNVDGWYIADAMQEDVDTIINATGALFEDVQQFDDDALDELAAWAEARTNDDKFDIIWLNGCVPSTLYPFPNLEPDGSVIEEWLGGGNMIINVGDWFGYVSYEGGGRKTENGPSGAANILNLSSGIIFSADNTPMEVTDDGLQYIPSLGNSCISYRPISISAVVDPWEVAVILAIGEMNDNAADPIVIHNTETGGYVAFVNQSAGSGPPGWLDDRGLSCAELIENWVAVVVGLDSSAVEPDGKLTATWGEVKNPR